MTTDQSILVALFGGVLVLLLRGRFRYDVIAFSALMLGVVLGVVPTTDAFAGFGQSRHDRRRAGADRPGRAGALGSGQSRHPHAGGHLAPRGAAHRPDGRDRRRAPGVHGQRGRARAPDAGGHPDRAEGRPPVADAAQLRHHHGRDGHADRHAAGHHRRLDPPRTARRGIRNVRLRPRRRDHGARRPPLRRHGWLAAGPGAQGR